ncbi:ferredoxin--NADP reductase [Nonlabens marinus]|uniref:Flavodoxin reductases (Ferredoxin-NADPH reductases) family 1 n=1 Tax=Nonlabens marinus S1-08 TaxID=1454201 RepID=W8VWI8_9FLAO|nr:ferredoxin--NADP reductase [Nonlabens marinus]BAO54772.1 flavodoxin reductases (ferredoxin-NADPH reductases) family 1 [Nonlabens marinus S1-08]
MTFHELSIQQVTKVTPRAVEIIFDIPQSLQNEFEYKAGQYLTLKATVDGQDVRRAYSISSAPSDADLKVVVKAVDKGLFSNYAMKLRAGDTLEVAPPEGMFVYDKEDNKDILLVAAGSGITPIMSILKTALASNAAGKVALIYGNQTESQTIYLEQLNDLKDAYEDRLVLKYCFSREERQDALFGRVNKANLNYFLNQDCDGLAFAKAYLCGPEEMIQMTQLNLEEKGILSKEDINFELFTTADSDIEITEDSHLSEITVILDDEQHSFTMRRDETLLDVMLKNDIDAPYSCQGGICSSCVGLIEEGEVKMRKNAILTDAEVADGLTLTCQACPTSAKVQVNFDEV